MNTEKNRTLWESISSLLFFSLSDKLKFSIKVSLSVVLAYLIPFSQGWSQAHVAAITIMIIAAMGSVNASVMKGAMRLLGTLTGAIIGMTLIAIFPQDRLLYLIVLSITVTTVLYILRAYKGDNSIFMLTAMTILLVFKNGEVDDVFIYGIDRTFMTTFGITIYTLVGVFLWPVNTKDNSEENAAAFSSLQFDLFLKRNEKKEERVELLENLLKHEQLLSSTTMDVSTASMNMKQWHSLVYNYKNINEFLILLANHDKEKYADNFPLYVKNYVQLEDEISILMKSISNTWIDKQEIVIPEHIEPEYQIKIIETLSHLEHASLLTTIQNMKKLHNELRILAKKLNNIISPIPTFFELEDIPKNRHFLWGDIEHLKGALVTFIIFWASTIFWITMNPPGGFLVVVAATGFSVMTTFSPLKPSMLIIIFTLSFIFSALMYVFVLPNLHYGWELGLFIFGYTFISFHLINPKMSIFFALGMVLMVLSNEMYYDFSFFLLLLLLFYLFLFCLQFFYYIPFSTKPEHLFLTMKKRFFTFSHILLERGRKYDKGGYLLLKVRAKYCDAHLMSTVTKMQLWASKIDVNYFNTIEKSILMGFTKECEKFTYMLKLLYHQNLAMKDNPLIKQLMETYNLPSLSDLLNEYALGKEMKDIAPFWKDEKKTVEKVEESLAQLLSDIDFNAYSEEVISELYENISLRRNVWLAFFSCQEMMEKIDFKILERSRF
ncbi:MAG: hypothetical protein B6D54_05855 [Epsilonproteobacteria bacterium 4484_65]|nr:MAG: hypothetical protein B6D54_05855 [Epsilonproteobacteria bacterium 4484_65]